MAECIRIFSQNCQGLADTQKRRSLFKHVRTKKYNIICLQDVHIQSKQESYIKAEWGFTRNSRGVMVLLNNNFEHKVERVKTDKGGNFIIIEINTQGKKLPLLIYTDPMKITRSFIII